MNTVTSNRASAIYTTDDDEVETRATAAPALRIARTNNERSTRRILPWLWFGRPIRNCTLRTASNAANLLGHLKLLFRRHFVQPRTYAIMKQNGGRNVYIYVYIHTRHKFIRLILHIIYTPEAVTFEGTNQMLLIIHFSTINTSSKLKQYMW